MQLLERHALYNLIRMNWLNDPKLKVEPWQVEDYRSMPTVHLFERLKNFKIDLDRARLISYAADYDAPEDFAECIISDQVLDAKIEDQIYLLIFEAWRRFMTDKPSLSILCNELDYQIYLHDTSERVDFGQLQNALASFALVLNDNVDQGLSAQEAFKRITPFFANDIESFLYDYIFEMIEDNELYAQDLLDNFAPYLKGNKWFEFLYIRLIEHTDHKLADKMLTHLLEDYLDQNDVDFNLELIAYLIDMGKNVEFKSLVLTTVKILQTEEDFQDLVMLCADFYHRTDKEKEESELEAILQERKKKNLEESMPLNDPAINRLIKVLKT